MKKKRCKSKNQDRDIDLYKPVERNLLFNRYQKKKNTSVYESLPTRNEGKWIMVGRLDINTSGLLIFSNNGDLVQKLSHPSSMIEEITYVGSLVTQPNLKSIIY